MSTSACQVSYLLKNSWHQTRILKSREPIADILKRKDISEETKRKLRLVLEAKVFATSQLGLKESSSYSSYVDLQRDYVTWIVQASPKDRIEAYRWWFPITGHVPYKGYFTKAGALTEAAFLKKKNYDTYVRGVTAYSTLGWFDDPVLSTMLRYNDYDLVSLIIHETVHSTLFIKSQADFNERLATFIGDKGAQRFFAQMQGGQEHLAWAKKESADLKLFSSFVTEELALLRQWYEVNQGQEDRTARLKLIQERFEKNVMPQLQTDAYSSFAKLELNNAVLLSFDLYQSNYDLFEAAFEKMGHDMTRFLDFCETLESAEDPEQKMRQLLSP